MKKLFPILILIFTLQTPSQADDIRDFQVEGMSVGDSLLDYFSEEEIKNSIVEDYYSYIEDKTFVDLQINENFEYYDGLQITIKRNDTKYIVYGIAGGKFYEDNIAECHSKMKEIAKELSIQFKNSIKNLNYKQTHPADKTGKSTGLASSFFLDSGNISVRCSDWSDEMTEKYNWIDNIRVSIKSKELNDWLLE